MAVFFFLLLVASLGALITGLINPSLFSFILGEKASRWTTSLLFAGLMLGSFIGFGVTAETPDDPEPQNQTQEQTQQLAQKDNGNQNQDEENTNQATETAQNQNTPTNQNSQSSTTTEQSNTQETSDSETQKDTQNNEGGNTGINETSGTVTVTRVIDGDTIEVSTGETIRLLGIDTPETGNPFANEATQAMKELVAGKEVKLERDVTNRGYYDRLLRYVWTGDTLVNEEIARRGYARSYTSSPDVKYQDRILSAIEEARNNNRGLWKPAEADSCIQVAELNANAPGNDNNNLNGEYVVFENTCDKGVNLTNATVRDEADHVFTFPQFTLNSEAQVTLYSGSGTNSDTELYWNRNNPRYAIWNNDGDTLTMNGSGGELILTYEY